jgi:hypothetical protein
MFSSLEPTFSASCFLRPESQPQKQSVTPIEAPNAREPGLGWLGQERASHHKSNHKKQNYHPERRLTDTVQRTV